MSKISAIGVATGLCLGLVGAGCGAPPPVQLPAPDSGQVLSVEEQRALGEDQLTEYCRMLDDYLEDLRGDIELAHAMTDSLDAVLLETNAEHADINREARTLETELRKRKAMRAGVTKYETREGDTLMGLSGLFYGAAADWRKIYEANRDLIDDPGAELKPGLQLVVPR